MKSRRKIAMLAIAILQLFPLLVLSAEVGSVAVVDSALAEPPKVDNKPIIPDEIPDADKTSRLLPDVIHHHVVPTNPPPKAVPVPAYYNYNPMLSYPPPSAMPMVAPLHPPPRYYNPYAAPAPVPMMQLTPADDRVFSKYQVAVVPPLIDRFPFNLWGPHGYYNLCSRTTPEDPVWSWGCAQAPYNVMGDVLQQQQQQQQQPQAQQFQQPPYFQQPPQAANPYPYLGSLPAASSTYNTYTLPSSPDPNLNFLQQLANQYAQNPSTGYTPNGYYNYGGGTYAPVPNTGNFMSSAAYSSAPGRIYNLGPRGSLRNLSKSKRQKKVKAKSKVKQPVVKVVEEEEEEVEEYVAEADEE